MVSGTASSRSPIERIWADDRTYWVYFFAKTTYVQ